MSSQARCSPSSLKMTGQNRGLQARHHGSCLWSQPFGRLRLVDHLSLGVWDKPCQHNETLSLLKIQKLAGCDGMHLLSQLLGRLRRENRLNPGGRGCSELRLHHYIPGWVIGRAFISNNKNNNNKNRGLQCKRRMLWIGVVLRQILRKRMKHLTFEKILIWK